MVVVCLFLCLSIKKNPVAKLDQRKTNFICIKMNLWLKPLYVVLSDLQQDLFWNRMETKTRKWHIGLILPIFPNLQDENNAFLKLFPLFNVQERHSFVYSNCTQYKWACLPASFMTSSKSPSYDWFPATLVLRPLSFASEMSCWHSWSDKKSGISKSKKFGVEKVKFSFLRSEL